MYPSCRLFFQEEELKRAKHITEETERKYEEILRKIQVLEADLEKAEERADEYQSKYHKAENENNQLITNIKSFEAADEHNAEKEANLEDQMAKLNAENTENERLVDQLRNENATLRKTVDELDENCDSLKRERDDANKQMEDILREMNEMA